MRQVTKKAAAAMRDGKNTVSGNTRVHSDGNVMELHGNTIAIFNRTDGLLTLRDCNWQTVTTKERLNGLLDTFETGKYITQENWNWYIKDRKNDKIKDEWTGFIVVKVGK